MNDKRRKSLSSRLYFIGVVWEGRGDEAGEIIMSFHSASLIFLNAVYVIPFHGK